MSIPKCAIGILLVRLFEPKRWIKHVIMVLCIVVCILGIAGFFMSLLDCRPVATQWDPYRYPNGHCWPQSTFNIYVGIFSGMPIQGNILVTRAETNCCFTGVSAFIDIAFAVHPGYVIWKLKLSKWQRISTTLLMGLGVA